MQNDIIYYQRNPMECVCYKNSRKSYPAHTHVGHIIVGYITDGEVCVTGEAGKRIYHAGECFCIMPDILHAVEAVSDTAYSMVSICVPVDEAEDKSVDGDSAQESLKEMILDTPENTYFIDDMAHSIGISPYHMIRKFKNTFGLTPHQFQIQCRVRKAQRLLEAGKSITEAAYATGFCDQSHFNRCFRKIVRLTPGEYKQAVKKPAQHNDGKNLANR